MKKKVEDQLLLHKNHSDQEKDKEINKMITNLQIKNHNKMLKLLKDSSHKIQKLIKYNLHIQEENNKKY